MARKKHRQDDDDYNEPTRLPSLRGLGLVGASRVLSGIGALAVDADVDIRWLSEATGCPEPEVRALVAQKVLSYDDTTKGTARKVVARVFARSVLVFDVIMKDTVSEYVRAVALEEQLATDLENARLQGAETEQLEDFLVEARAKKLSAGYRMLDLHKDFSKIMQNMGMASLFTSPDQKPLTPTDHLLAKPTEDGAESVDHEAILDEVTKQMNDVKLKVARFAESFGKPPEPVTENDNNSQNT